MENEMREPLFEIVLPEVDKLDIIILERLIQQTNAEKGIPLVCNHNHGNLLLIHPLHENDYCGLEIALTNQSFSTTINCFLYGRSKQWNKKVHSDASSEYLTKGYWGNQLKFDNSFEFLLRGTLHKLQSFGFDEISLLEEEQYLRDLIGLVKETFHAK